jgi:hypothetical protein
LLPTQVRRILRPRHANTGDPTMSSLRPLAILLLCAPALPAFAEQSMPDPEEIKALRTYCKADVERLCAGVQPGGGRIKTCLMEHKEQMSVGCAQALQKMQKSKP